jgi:phosphatidylinositol-3-phosphatase
MNTKYLNALTVVVCLVTGGTADAATLYQYDFDNGTTGSWGSTDASWNICRTVSTGTQEYCQTDAAAQLSSTSFDGDPAWADYSIQADVKIYNYLSGEIGIIGRAQDASHYYQLSLTRDEQGNRKWWILKNDGGVVTVLASGVQYFQSGYYYLLRLRMYKQHLEASISSDKGLTFNALGFAEDTRYRNGRIGLMTRNTKGAFDNVAVNTLGGVNVRRFGHVVVMSLENQNYANIIGNPYMPYLNSLIDRSALLTNFYANFHPSQPDYFSMTTGQGFYTKEGPIPAATNNIVRALATTGKNWRGYYTDLTTHEAVFRYFPEVWQNSTQLANIVPIFPNFMNDVTAGTLASYSIIHDLPSVNGHDCVGAGACMGIVDDRLRETIDGYINHPSFIANKDLLIVAFDEADLKDVTCSGPMTIPLTPEAALRGAWKCGGQAVVMLIGAEVKRGYKSTTLYHHEALLRIALEGLGVTDSLPGASAFAPEMNELFQAATVPASYNEVVLHTQRATTTAGQFRIDPDATAAGGSSEHHPDVGAAKVATPLAAPANYFEMTFNADAGKAYRLWIRGKAERNYYGNDSVYFQFSQSVTSSGTPIYRIGTTGATAVVLEDCSGCALSGWGWNDNGYGAGVLGPVIYFEKSGPQKLRVQGREDGIFIDQIVLSAEKYLTAAPGAVRADATIVPRTQ